MASISIALPWAGACRQRRFPRWLGKWPPTPPWTPAQQGGRRRIGTGTGIGQGPEIHRAPFDDHVWTCAQDHLETVLAERAASAGVPDLPVSIAGIRAFEMTAALADSYRAGRAVLAGDAAHVFTPATGMGLNLAIHDGAVLAGALADAISHGDRPEALDQYEQACRPIGEKLLEAELAPA
jgi:2-polyprenyl-6-methoxyphenol hydroxylase-like FAD-dependent oxidoreductase